MSCGRPSEPQDIGAPWRQALRRAALDQGLVSGLTHRFYRYPARFSPTFAGTAIDLFSKRGDIVLDPYMGGGTTIVEAVVRGRQAVGSDINSLAVFLATVKTAVLSATSCDALRAWADDVIPSLSYWDMPEDLDAIVNDRRAYNLTLPQARPIKKIVALALCTLSDLPNRPTRDFARCALLNATQLFLNGQKRRASLNEFRPRLQTSVHEMLTGLGDFQSRAEGSTSPILLNCSAADLSDKRPFADGDKASLVITSPPYPGIHMLYHRWQVDGRRETPAPYWMANCKDGRGNAFYNFADRSASAEDKYFVESLRTLNGIRAVMQKEGLMVQLVAFSDPARQLRRYLKNMEQASFEEVRQSPAERRLWRNVPSRSWHANLKGKLNGSREVVLVHRAI